MSRQTVEMWLYIRLLHRAENPHNKGMFCVCVCVSLCGVFHVCEWTVFVVLLSLLFFPFQSFTVSLLGWRKSRHVILELLIVAELMPFLCLYSAA